MNYRIVSDSSSNLLSLSETPYTVVPLHILVGDKAFVDDDKLNLNDMYEALASHKGTTSTSCPSPQDWIQAFHDADIVFCITITSGLSGSCSSAHVAKQMYEEQHPDRTVYIVDSLSTGPQMVLLIEKMKSLLDDNLSPEEVYEQVQAYHKHTHLFYSLASLHNLAKNGRVNPLLAKGIGALGIRIIGTASKEGTLKPVDKARGDKKATQKIFHYIKENGYRGGRTIISHSDNLESALQLRDLIISEFGHFDGFIHENTALCSYYAEQNSMLVGFESQEGASSLS